jgi:hypothetical protein
MAKLIQKSTVAIASTAISLFVLNATSLQAAVFTFSLNSGEQNFGEGSLSFDDRSLTGVGTQTIRLSNLVDGLFQINFTGAIKDATFGEYWFGDSPALNKTFSSEINYSSQQPSFRFEQGKLVGISLFEGPVWGEVITTPSTCFIPGVPTPQICNLPAYQAASYFSINGDLWRDSMLIYAVPPNGSSFPRPTGLSTSGSGEINFTTVVPFKSSKSVPEPTSLMGFSVLGLSLFLKKKLAFS